MATRSWRYLRPYFSNFQTIKRCRLSTTTNDATSKILMRHFLFQVHPDYFQQHKPEQEVNTRNYALLQDVHTKLLQQQQQHHNIGSGVRTLLFYMKPTDHEPIPRRVKVFIASLRSLEESMVDILDTAGSTLPPDVKATIIERHAKMTGDGSSTGRMGSDAAFLSGSSCTPQQVVHFLDTLIDRKELMNWRQDRARSLGRLLEVVQNTLGVEGIDIRYSWSAQNNTILLESLLRLVSPREVFHTLGCPWRGMTLVLSADDCSQLPVDPVEAHVMINPSQVPLQWMAVFKQVGQPALLETALRSQQEIARLVAMFDLAASTQLQLAVITHVRRHLHGQGIGRDFFQSTSAGRRQVAGLSVKVRRGHTCSRRWYMLFLGRMEDAMSRVIAHHPPLADTTSADSTTPTTGASSTSTPGSTFPHTSVIPTPGGITFTPVTPVRSDSGSGSGLVGGAKLPLVVITTTNALTHSTSDSDSGSGSDSGSDSRSGSGSGTGRALLGEQFSFLAHLPLTIELVVEEGHGTKLLPSGELRMDCRASPGAVQELIASKCLESLELSATHKVLKDSVDELSQAVVARLGLASVEAGVGVDLRMMEACLYRLKQHAQRRGANTTNGGGSSGSSSGTGRGDGTGSGNGHGNGRVNGRENDNNGRGKLAALAGMRVRIGRYLGIADDGSVTFPHDFPDFS